ncbi:DUF397 domain-containing protein [Streptomyces sp. SP17BM10]|uniref:DUF397 domain-containing protein n=1 Tax=Streptomyces sp. SP17BM10 TaxID=3002530 RepID=UPI002E7A39DE|nr:DUF397 domain-containing protein [Streptomyces sp. SP17BM10]MEE1786177.1 DUF397 domain-containing protein [Streptomyces sp. SP17BM10]
MKWRKSSYSNTTGGDCVEIAEAHKGAIAVRDSKDPHGPALGFSPEAWQAFVAGIQAGDFPTTP